jgi:toxin secretion/phage lysis holin
MESYFTELKIGIAAFFTAVSALLGWQGIMALVWVIAMAIDYITGTAAAFKAGQWSSAIARQGLWHKGGMIVVVIVAAIADCVMAIICEHIPIGIEWISIVLPLVLAWYIVTELGSILENAVKMGANVPQWLIHLLKIGLKAIDEAGEKLENEEAPANQNTDTIANPVKNE